MPVVVPKTIAQMQKDYYALIDHLARDWWVQQCANVYSTYYLIGRKGLDAHTNRIWMRLRVGTEAHEGEEYVRPEPLPRGATLERIARLLQDWTAREPLYVFAD